MATNLRVYQEVRRSVFAIAASHSLFPERPTPPDRGPLANDAFVFGTGFLADSSGIVVTAAHVVRDLVNRTNKFADGILRPHQKRPRLIYQAQFVPPEFRPPEAKSNAPNELTIGNIAVAATSYLFDDVHDLAVLFTGPVHAERHPFDLKPVLYAREEAMVGDEVITCGYPFGSTLNEATFGGISNPPTYSRGIVGAILPEASAPLGLRTLFRFDATALPGSSGGPVCRSDNGKLVGMLFSGAVHNVFHLGTNTKPTAVPVGFPQAIPLIHIRSLLEKARASREQSIQFGIDAPPVTPDAILTAG